MAEWIVSLYGKRKRAFDCIPDTFATREAAETAAAEWMAMAREARESGNDPAEIAWAHRFTIRRI